MRSTTTVNFDPVGEASLPLLSGNELEYLFELALSAQNVRTIQAMLSSDTVLKDFYNRNVVAEVFGAKISRDRVAQGWALSRFRRSPVSDARKRKNRNSSAKEI
jgi:hypothetical protein